MKIALTACPLWQWFWGADDTMWVHLAGMRDIVRLHDGFSKLASNSKSSQVRICVIIL